MQWLASNPAHWLRDALGDLPWQAQHPLWQALVPRFAAYSPHLYRFLEDDGFWLLDLRSVSRLWRGDLLKLAVQLERDCLAWAPASVTTPLILGLGKSPWQAAARVQCALHLAPSPGGVWSRPDIDVLPLKALPPLRKALKPLAAMGIHRWGELKAVPRAGVMRRWGRVAIDVLDQAYGVVETPLKTITVPDTFVTHTDLAEPVSDLAALCDVAAQMIEQMCTWLNVRQQVATAIEWRWCSEKRQNAQYADEPTETQLLLRASDAHADSSVWWRLTQTHWQQKTLAQPAIALFLTAIETHAQTDSTAGLWQAMRGQSDETLGSCLDRLQGRLGVDAVRKVVLQDAIAPESQQVWTAYDPSAARTQVRTIPKCGLTPVAVDPRQVTYQGHIARTADVHLLRPPWLLPSPQRLVVKDERPVFGTPLRLLMGPERIELVGWSMGAQQLPIARDYYVAWSSAIGLVWVYKMQEKSPDSGAYAVRWYLHGLYG